MRVVMIGRHSDNGDGTRRAIADMVEQAGAEVVLPEETLRPGENWALRIQEEIQHANGVVADFTDAGPWVTYEVGIAVGLNKPLLAVVRKGASDAPLVVDGVWYFVYDESNWDKLRSHIQSWVRHHLRAHGELMAVA